MWGVAQRARDSKERGLEGGRAGLGGEWEGACTNF